MTAPATDAAGRALTPCDQPYVLEQIGRRPRKVTCNRVMGHGGPHRAIRRRDFATIAEWSTP